MNRLLIAAALLIAPALALWPSAPVPAPTYLAYQPYEFVYAAPSGMRPDDTTSPGDWREDFADTSTQENNPWRHVRMTALFIPPTATPQLPNYLVPGFYCGDSTHDGTGNYWCVRWTPPEELGNWTMEIHFEDGTDINVDDPPALSWLLNTSTPDYTKTLNVVGSSDLAGGFQARGFVLPFQESASQLGCKYLTHSDGGIYLSLGVGGPENFLAYKEFSDMDDETAGKSDDTAPNSTVTAEGADPEHWLHDYDDYDNNYGRDHATDWSTGDPTWTANGSSLQGKGIIGALNYLGEDDLGLTSMYFLLMNLGGDGRDVSPFHANPVDASHATHGDTPTGGTYDDSRHFYDCKRLDEWNIVFEHANEQGLLLNLFLAETEDANTDWLDDSGDRMGLSRKLFLKNMVAMFGHNPGITWTMFEETPWGTYGGTTGNNEVSIAHVAEMAQWVRDWDFCDYDTVRSKWIGHATSTHCFPNTNAGGGGFRKDYERIRDDTSDANWWLDAGSMQINEGSGGGGGNTHSFSSLTENTWTDFDAGGAGGSGSSSRLVVLNCDEQGHWQRGTEEIADVTDPLSDASMALHCPTKRYQSFPKSLD